MSRIALSAAVAALGLAAVPAFAQQPQEFANSKPCGGLICDLGLFGFHSAPPEAPPPGAPAAECGFMCRTFGIGAPPPAPPQMVATAPEPVPAEPVKKARHHRKKAKAEAPAAAQ